MLQMHFLDISSLGDDISSEGRQFLLNLINFVLCVAKVACIQAYTSPFSVYSHISFDMLNKRIGIINRLIKDIEDPSL